MRSMDLAETYRARGWWRTDETLVDDLRRAAREHPDRRAVVVWHTDGRDTETLTYAELERRVDRIAAGLAGLGVERGDVVTLQLPNSWQLLATTLACARIGAVAGPVLPIMRKRELTFMTELTKSPVYIGPVEHRGFSHAQLSEEVAREVASIRERVLVGVAGSTADLGGARDFDTALLGEPGTEGAVFGDIEGREAKPDDLAYVMFTSGTTGEPKGVMHSHNTLHATNRMQIDALHLRDDEVTAMGSPTTHNAGWTWNFTMPLLLGATCVHIDNWDADLMLRVLEEEKVTFFMGAPPFLVDLIDRQRAEGRDLSSLHTFATGSAPIPPVLVEQARDVLGCRLYALWGMTENGAPTITRPEDPEMRAAESDGSPVPGMEVRIVGEDGAEVAPGETGRLQVRGATQCLGYFRRPEVYEDNLTADGWFDTGDLARSDGHGGIRIAGREKDVISRGGEKVPVVEVEAALLRHPDIKDVAVVAYPDDRLGERACAVIVPQGTPPELPALREHLDGLGMAKQYWPERVEHVGELPTTPSGKVQKFKLREQLV
ncbi:cyclohexanecarboxylate-CoA ligase [Lentzea guizhouensis]|uniref:Cyclohexanecarboxylate-CoA ligase n=2 Tax=Lentzea guizhouensis TaxID=1586287 RepID=A0A1B2HSV3_9PSEU|nr:cyclohexanecarboxylate-CoA ligase [Lentzea guizhouensis]